MQAQGPIIKGMNHAVTAGALAAEAFVEMNEKGDSGKAGERYELKLRQTGLMSKLRPPMYSVVKVVAENKVATAIVDGVLTSPVGRVAIRAMGKRIGKLYNVPILSMAIPDTSTPYVTLPTIIGQEVGEIIKSKNLVDPPELADRISKLAYDTDIGKPHIELIDNSYAVSGGAVTACPVSAVGFGGGCYRVEEIEVDGTVELRVSLDTQPCIECGTCAVVAETEWSNPRGNKGVEFKYG
jgi:electron transfer flavoprotein-quinone oxidoreductase